MRVFMLSTILISVKRMISAFIFQFFVVMSQSLYTYICNNLDD